MSTSSEFNPKTWKVGEIQRIPIESITDRYPVRVASDDAFVSTLVGLMRQSVKLDPIQVFIAKDEAIVVLDGRTRILAHIEQGYSTILANRQTAPRSDAEAFQRALQLNQNTQSPNTKADYTRVAWKLLRDGLTQRDVATVIRCGSRWPENMVKEVLRTAVRYDRSARVEHAKRLLLQGFTLTEAAPRVGLPFAVLRNEILRVKEPKNGNTVKLYLSEIGRAFAPLTKGIGDRLKKAMAFTQEGELPAGELKKLIKGIRGKYRTSQKTLESIIDKWQVHAGVKVDGPD